MKKLTHCIGFLLSMIAASSAIAANEAVDRPQLQVGDTWTYRQTADTKAGFKEERLTYTLTRVTAKTLYMDQHQDGSNQPPRSVVYASDWSRMRSVNGVETVVSEPLNFPLSPNKTWQLHFREERPNPQRAWEDWTNDFVVVGHETVKVGAGEFDAIKIEAEGKWRSEVVASSQVSSAAQGASGNATISSTVASTAPYQIEGRIYKAFWYVPAVKRWVKVVEETYSTTGVRYERSVHELESFNVH
ncbi:MAG: hypothetical protein JOY60_09695 [Burkholderiaceae bacterium]|nr:hypothetical protein [Roseateles sp.]MBV8470116.1 hypothetical protein [Burkholderiaceae bacterium]